MLFYLACSGIPMAMALGLAAETEPSAANEFRHESFIYRKWVSEKQPPETVVIALHGFNGSTHDYQNLASHLVEHQPKTAVYAYEIRGQGRHPNEDQRGDIENAEQWSQDLLDFTEFVKSQHPETPVVWFGESMGALIIAQTYHREISRDHEAPCHAIALSSPVVKIHDKLPEWKIQSILKLSKLTPTTRISLSDLIGDFVIPMTHQSNQQADSTTPNSWSVKTYTLRHLAALANMIDAMPQYALSIDVPTLVLHGGRDFFGPKEAIDQFLKKLQNVPSTTREFYPEGHHLLMYDRVKEHVIQDVEQWLTKLNAPKKLSN